MKADVKGEVVVEKEGAGRGEERVEGEVLLEKLFMKEEKGEGRWRGCFDLVGCGSVDLYSFCNDSLDEQ